MYLGAWHNPRGKEALLLAPTPAILGGSWRIDDPSGLIADSNPSKSWVAVSTDRLWWLSSHYKKKWHEFFLILKKQKTICDFDHIDCRIWAAKTSWYAISSHYQLLIWFHEIKIHWVKLWYPLYITHLNWVETNTVLKLQDIKELLIFPYKYKMLQIKASSYKSIVDSFCEVLFVHVD